MKPSFLVSAIILFGCGTILAKTPVQIAADLAGIMPNGKKARAVWIQGNQVHGVDSDDGQVRQLSSGSIAPDWPCLSGNASRVFFYDNNSGEVRIINWTSGATSTLQANYVSSGEVSIESWVDPSDGSDWVLIGQSCSGQIGRIKVDNPSQCVKVWNTGTSPSPSWGDGIGLSLDGTRLGAMWSVGGNFASGVGNIAAGTVKRHSTWIGCGVSMTPDNTYRVTFAEGDGNAQIIHISTGENPVSDVPALAAIRTLSSSKGYGGGEMNNQRWTNNPDYLAVCMSGCKGYPFLYKLSTNTVIAIQDGSTSVTAGHADVCFFSGAGTTVLPRVSQIRTGTPAGNRSPALFAIDGRRILPSAARKGVQQVVVRSMILDGPSRLATTVVAR